MDVYLSNYRYGGRGGYNGGGGGNTRGRYHDGDDDYHDTRGGGGGNTYGGGDRDRDRRYDPTAPSNDRTGPPLVLASIDSLDMTDMRRFLMSPSPKRVGIIQCYITRNKSGTNKLFPEYKVYMKEGDRFLMGSKKRPNNATSNYLISMAEGDLNRSSGNFLGKLRSNFVGTEFQIFDDGLNPRDVEPEDASALSRIRRELGAVFYAANVLGTKGPRKMQVVIPRVEADDSSYDWRSLHRDDEMLSLARNHDYSHMHYFINKPPRWNDQVGAYVLNFNGRVTMASVKNFQMVPNDDQENVVLQFGRVAQDMFTMDFAWPLSPLQAFAVTLSSFDSKIACD